MRWFNPATPLMKWFLSDEYRPERLRYLFWPGGHPKLIANRRNQLILSRIGALAAVFGVLTLLWIPLDIATLPIDTAGILAMIRLVSCSAFGYLVVTTRRRPSLWLVYRSLALLYAIPTVFYFASLLLLKRPELGPYARTELHAYWALPIVAMAGLGIFPLTVVECLAFCLPIVSGEVLAFTWHIGVFFPGGVLDAVWMFVLMTGIAIFVGISQLGFSIVLVGQSLYDTLTQCYSRGSIGELLDQHFTASVRKGTPLSLAFLDLDHFKQINDVFGHDVGDTVLVSAARSIQTGLRGEEVVGRWGGEEFLVIFPGKTAAEAIQSVQQMRGSGIARCPGGRPVTVSVGVAERLVDHCADGPSLVRAADQRMYTVKGSGRDRVYGPDESQEDAVVALRKTSDARVVVNA